jgi:L-lactate dehydrogenase complex protein LldG
MSPFFDAFKTRATAVSAEVHRFGNREEALGFIRGFLAEAGVGPEAGAVWADQGLLSAAEREALAGLGVSFEISQAACAAAKVGISQLEWGIAATGTLVQDASAVEKRLVSTLPPIHLALLASEGILEDLGSALERIHPRQANYISFITGPSRTADIERVLTIGVHGPERLIIVVVDGLQQVSA